MKDTYKYRNQFRSAVNHKIAFSVGAKDGQVIMVRNGAAVEAHEWSEKDTKWIKIGDVVSSSNKKSTIKQTKYNGKYVVPLL